MRWLLPLLFVGSALAAESPREIDPNTRIEGGAQTENRNEAEKPPLSAPPTVPAPEKRDSDRSDADKDKAISERKPQEREREDASRGETRNAPQQ